MKKLKVGLVGASGRMGQEISKVLSESSRCDLYYSFARAEKWNEKKGKEVDVWIDFSSPESLKDVLQRALETKKPVVCGTTGFSQKEKDLLTRYSKKFLYCGLQI